jgi:purine nucleoside permease
MKRIIRNGLALCVFGGLSAPGLHAAEVEPPLKVKAVIVTMFEVGKDTGDTPGEFQLWVEREKLDKSYPLPSANHDVLANDKGVIGIVTGVGTARAAATVMALGSDPRFDLTKAYWLIAGIAGIDPADASIGSSVWSDWTVDGDLAHEIDEREMPKDWSTGYVPLGSSTPYAKDARSETYQKPVFRFNPELAEWAYQLTKDTPLLENDVMKKNRERYTDTPNAMKPPFVLKGENMASGTFWHGKLLNQWANDWIKYWTGGNYVTTAMEDTGSMQSLTWLARAGKVDLQRVMLLRTASNFDSQPPGMSAAESLAQENAGHYSAYIPSLEAAHRVGSRVIHELTEHWDKYEIAPPK